MSTLFSSFIAGGCAGCAVDLGLFPIDSIKTSLQAGKPIDFSKMYSGLLWTMMSSFPCAATFWTAYMTMKMLLSSLVESPALVHFLSATFGSVCAALVRNPFEVIKQQMQVGIHTASFNAPFDIIRKEGITGLYAGIAALVTREIPFDTIQMLLYEFLKGNAVFSSLINGAVAGAFAAFWTTPIDVVKTRMMTDGGKGVYKDFWQSFQTVAKQGVADLWKGWHVRVLFTTVGGMIFFGTFETIQQLI